MSKMLLAVSGFLIAAGATLDRKTRVNTSTEDFETAVV